MMDIDEQSKHYLDIAVIGMAGRFPGASDLQDFWNNLKQGVESIRFFSQDEVVDSGVHPETMNNPDFVPAAGTFDGEYMFDAEFFNLTPAEAEIMDPQHRVLLECSWEALESAGYAPESYPGRIGIYAGTSMNGYFLFHIIPNRKMLNSIGLLQAMVANEKDYVATRVAYKLNLKGPAITVQTGCSTSLVAVGIACQSLLSGQNDMALAAAASITPKGRLWEEGSIFSRDGHCRPFDAQADGTVCSNGAGVIVLKRLEDALADHDTIRAVIRATSINNDGSLKPGFSAPSVNGQVDVILAAQAIAGVDPESISYVEAHGSATGMGDQVEIEALTQAFRMHTDKKEYCAIGSVKGNIGHLDAAAGISGLIKTVLALENKQIPPSLNFRIPNPLLKLEDSPFFVNSVLRDWNTSGPHRAALSSFGLGGTNAHAILEEAPAFEPSGSSRECQILPISARNHTALQAASQDLARYFKTQPHASLADAAFTLQTGRRHFTQRAFAVANNTRGAEIVFATRDPKRLKTGTAGHKCSVAFMFPGEGSQFVNMAGGLYREEPQFRQSLEQCAHLVRPHLERDLLEIIYPAPQQAACEKLLSQTQYAEPAIFAIEYALAVLWQSWGVLPESMIGCSVGEYVAACLAGVFSLEDGVRLVCARAKLIHSQTMEENAAHFVRLFAGVKLSSPRLPFLSNVTGDWITSQQACSPEYWAAHLRSTVRFDEGLQHLLETKPTVLLEVGPGQALTAAALQQPELVDECVLLTSSPDAHAAESDLAHILNSIGTLWTHGMNIHWQQLHSGETRRRIPLPTYQFQRKLYWLPPIHQSDSPTEVRSMDSNVSKEPRAA